MDAIPILTTAETAATDAAAVREGLSIDRLMRRAGEAVAEAVMDLARPGQPIAVLSGPGNNGGDGYVAARLLRARGAEVSVFALAPPCAEGPARRAAAAWRADAGDASVRPIETFRPTGSEIVVDALYGAGLSRPVAGTEAEALRRAAAAGCIAVAVDVPSGIDGDTGQPLGPCLPARRTVTFFRPKPAHALLPGRALCGDIVCADIGLAEAHAPASPARLHVNGPALWRALAPKLAVETHKYARGHALVVSGAELQTGAARLAAQAALRGGCGAVTIAGSLAALRIHAAHVTAIMLHPAETAEDLAAWIGARRPGAVVFGPAAGVDGAARARLAALGPLVVPLVLDADALTLLGADARGLDAPAPRVLTPHVGEFRRLFPDLGEDPGYASLSLRLQASKIEQARAAARLSGAIVAFKGGDTVVAAPDGRAAVNVNAGPELATAGSGDVLAGLVGSLLAQGMPAFEAAAAAVWLHGETGRLLGEGLTADDLAAAVRPLGAALRRRDAAPRDAGRYLWQLAQKNVDRPD